MNTIHELAAPRVEKKRAASHRMAIGNRSQPSRSGTIRISLFLDDEVFRRLLDRALHKRTSVADEAREIIGEVLTWE